MDNILEWGEQYSVGNEEIDAQHRRLFDIGMNIISADVEIAQKVVEDLCAYAQEHFSSEEAHMRSIGYPQIDAHLELHKELLNQLFVLLKKGIRKPKDAEQVKNFFLCWLLDHVMMQDMKYFYYTQGKKGS